jgi:hypothetical protein
MSFLNKYCEFEIKKICKILLDGMPDKSYVRLEKPFSDNPEKSIYKKQSNDLNMINNEGFFRFKHGITNDFNTLKGGDLAKIYQQLIRGEYKVVRVKPFERTQTTTKFNNNWKGWKNKGL